MKHTYATLSSLDPELRVLQFINTVSTERVDAPHPARRATEAYWASTVRERNEAGADAAALEH